MLSITRRDFLKSTAAAGVCFGAPGAAISASDQAALPFPTVGDRARLVPAPLDAYREAKLSGGPGKDGIPSIDAPEFWTVQEADDYLEDADKVIGLVEGIAHALIPSVSSSGMKSPTMRSARCLWR
ncbi:DUF3179 domain-containing (seleno)protein [Fodinicurvata halophila]|uniref:DUF3179 domain-containing (seleno)protein n=1 Tax=Fodinicurvata halophila TaxID=1419723 RepID=UPI003632C715